MRRSHAVNKYEGFITIRCVCLQMIARYVPHCALIELQRRIEWQGCGFAAQGSATGHAQALPGNKTYQPRQRDKERIPCAPFHAGVELRGYGVSSAIRNAALFSIAAPGDDAVLTLRQNDRQRELWLSPRLRFPAGSSRIERIWRGGIPRLIRQERLSGEALQSAVWSSG